MSITREEFNKHNMSKYTFEDIKHLKADAAFNVITASECTVYTYTPKGVDAISIKRNNDKLFGGR